MPLTSRRAYTVGLGALALAGAIAAAAMRAPDLATTWHLDGLTVVAVPDDTADGVVAEAWLGGGVDDDHRPLAHLAEHVALAQAGGALDGRVTPEATIVRAAAPGLAETLVPLWRAMTAVEAHPAVVAAELAALAAEPGGERPGVGRAGGPAAVAAHWRQAWRAHRATLVVRGRFVAASVPGFLGRWPGTRRARPRRWLRSPAGRALAPGPLPTAAGAPVVAVAAAATGRAALLSGTLLIEPGRLAWPAPGDRDAWREARRSADRLPIVGARGPLGVLAAALHLTGDPTWPARYRRAVAAVTPAAALAAARAIAAAAPPRSRRQARPALAPVRAVGRVRLEHRPGATVHLRWLWPTPPAVEDLAARGATALAAASLARCLDGSALDALGGRAEVVVERDRVGVRAELPADGWRDAVGVIIGCLAAPDESLVGHARDRERLAALARDLAGSAQRQALALFVATRYGDDPLAAAVAAAPPPGLSARTVAAWWRDHHRLADAAVAAIGPIELADLTAALASGPPTAVGPSAPAAVARPPLAPAGAREVFVDGAPGQAALAVGVDGLPAGDPDRAALEVLAAYLAEPAGPLAAARAGAIATRIAVADTLDRGYLAVVFDQPADRAATVWAARAALARLAAAPPDAATVAAVRDRLLVDGAELRRRLDALAIAGLTARPPSPGLAAVDAAAVARLAARLFGAGDLTVATVRPRDESPAVARHRDHRGRRRRRAR